MPTPKGYKHKRKRETHGASNTKLYKVWSSMKDRCSNPKSKYYHNYGKRGISYDPKWETFNGFFADVGDTYRIGLTLDRIDNEGDYCKSNCKWVTRKDQLRNTRRNIWLTHDGKTKLLTEWADDLGMSYQSLKKRLDKGWPLEKALTTKPKRVYVNK